MELSEPYPQAHEPWKPFCVDQVFEYITYQAAKEDMMLYESMMSLLNRGLSGTDYAFAVLSMCQSADAIIQAVMRNTYDV